MRNLIYMFLVVSALFPFKVLALCNPGHPRDDVLIIVNDNSIDSPQVGDYYCEQRGIAPENIAHILAPTSFFIDWPDFVILRDQIIKKMQDLVVAKDPDFVPQQCNTSSYTSVYYCPESMDQLRANTGIRYVVFTKGVPTRMKVDPSITGGLNKFPNAPASVDNFLKYWLWQAPDML